MPRRCGQPARQPDPRTQPSPVEEKYKPPNARTMEIGFLPQFPRPPPKIVGHLHLFHTSRGSTGYRACGPMLKGSMETLSKDTIGYLRPSGKPSACLEATKPPAFHFRHGGFDEALLVKGRQGREGSPGPSPDRSDSPPLKQRPWDPI